MSSIVAPKLIEDLSGGIFFFFYDHVSDFCQEHWAFCHLLKGNHPFLFPMRSRGNTFIKGIISVAKKPIPDQNVITRGVLSK